ncbi:hypothetical protein BR93DRAFT_461043 [Coniochaeta sp. PMI_546]|nr:hypothetical protein BR93DRAFT_461043 [Coniochaeta sp. PMI_546]
MVHDYSRNDLPRWPGDRLPVERLPGDNRYNDSPPVRRPLVSIDEALREHCNIPVRSYFLAVVTDDGRALHFSGPDNLPQPDPEVQQFFSLPHYIQYNKSRGLAVSSPTFFEDFTATQLENNFGRQSGGPQYPSRRTLDRRQIKADTFEDEPFQYKTRKRPRAHVYRRDLDDDDAPVSSTSARKPIKIGDSDALWQFYDQRFRNCQQTACKLIAKAWVKAVEPKKQSNHPYTGSDEKAPDWWPKPWGPSRDEKVRHKEPDHLYKKERVHLLNHILRMVVEPNAKQHPDIQKLNLNVKKLEEVTTDALSTFFSDKENNNNAKKKPFLKEIFKVAKAEERYKNGEIDADYTIHVMPDDKMPDSYQSDNEDSAAREGDDNGPTSISSSLSPNEATAPHALITTPSTEHSPAGALHGGPFVNDLPVRPAQYTQSMITSELVNEQHHYAEGGGITGGAPTTLQSHGSMAMTDILASSDPSRRSSFYSPSEYTNPPSTGIYNANNWQTATTAPSAAPMYANAFTPQQQHHPTPPAQGAYAPQQGVTMAQGQPYMGASYDGMHRYDSVNDLFRPTAVSHNPASQSPGYPTYVHHDNRPQPATGYKLDPLGRNTLH